MAHLDNIRYNSESVFSHGDFDTHILSRDSQKISTSSSSCLPSSETAGLGISRAVFPTETSPFFVPPTDPSLTGSLATDHPAAPSHPSHPPVHLSEFYSIVDSFPNGRLLKTSPYRQSLHTVTPATPNMGSPSPTRNSQITTPSSTLGLFGSNNPSISSTPRQAFSNATEQPFHAQSQSHAQHSRNSSSAAEPGFLNNLIRRASNASFATETSTIASTSFGGMANAHPDLPALITSTEVKRITNCYTNALSAASRYRDSLLAVSNASADFGAALEECARCKGAGTSADGLLAAGGLHYLVSNHQQILAKSIQRSFEVPVQKQLDKYLNTSMLNEEQFKAQLKAKTKQLRAHEQENIKLSRKKMRNLAQYRSSLLELTSQIDDIDKLKYDYFQSAYDLAHHTSVELLTYASSVVRAEVEIYEGIARKGWSGGGLDDLIASCPDPFSAYDDDEMSSSVDNKYDDTNENDNSNQRQGPNSGDSPVFDVNAKITNPRKNTNTEIFSILPTSSILPSVDHFGSNSRSKRFSTTNDDNDFNDHANDIDNGDEHSSTPGKNLYEQLSKAGGGLPRHLKSNNSLGTVRADESFDDSFSAEPVVSHSSIFHSNNSTPRSGGGARGNRTVSGDAVDSPSAAGDLITSTPKTEYQPRISSEGITIPTSSASAPISPRREIVKPPLPGGEHDDTLGYSGWDNVHTSLTAAIESPAADLTREKH